MVKTKKYWKKKQAMDAVSLLMTSLFFVYSVLAPLNIFMIYVGGWFAKVINHVMTTLERSITVFMVDYSL